MSIVFRGLTHPDANTSNYQLRWDEPGKTQGRILFEVQIKTRPGESEQSRKDEAIKEALRLARAFVASEAPDG